MKLAVVGSREFTDYQLAEKEMSKFNPEEIISGGARGADSLGARYAIENGIKLTEFLPDWDRFGRAAGFIRNKDIIASCDEALIFWNGLSKGTKNDIDLCQLMNKKYTIVNVIC